MVTIRLARGGMKKTPFYQVVVVDSRCKQGGRFIERLGFFNPVAKGRSVRLEINADRLAYWLGTGAQTTERVKTLIKEARQLAAAQPVEAAVAAVAE